MFIWIKRNPLVVYFALTYAISWTVWAPIVAVEQGWPVGMSLMRCTMLAPLGR